MFSDVQDSKMHDFMEYTDIGYKLVQEMLRFNCFWMFEFRLFLDDFMY